MDTISYKTKSANKQTVQQEWYVVDAENMVVGRLATKVAMVLRGKHKPCYTPHVDCGDHVIILNADKVRFTGNKMEDKYYLRYSGYPGGQRKTTAAMAMAKKPRFIIENAVRGMLPKNRLGRQMFRKLHVYEGNDHPHKAQKAKPFNF